MAVKERKQITGTTAQINAYDGHEGQIVWDKEKKTLVGMSGTAGKNYPLAPKEYVDNEVAKVNTEVAKKASSAELTQGLAGKEDKGTCLPLTGGTLSGNVYFPVGNIISNVLTEDNKLSECIIGSDGHGGDLDGVFGAFLTLRNSHTQAEIDRGSFGLFTRGDDSSIAYVLHGRRNGDLDWGGKPIVWQEHTQAGCIRFSNGIQFIWDFIVNVPNGYRYTFPLPFINTIHGLQVTTDYGEGINIPRACWVGNVSTTSCTIHWTQQANYNMYIRLAAFGRWK